jgi:hemerythrin superfamily protein
MDAVEYLTNDHRKVEAIFKQFEQGIKLHDANQLFIQLYQELNLHALAEENVFYPALARNPDLSHQLKDAFKDHSEVKAMFGELAALDITTTEWRDKMSKLIKSVKQHVEEEESGLFPRARQYCSAQELQDLTAELEKAKELSTPAVMNSLPMKELDHAILGASNEQSYGGSQQL